MLIMIKIFPSSYCPFIYYPSMVGALPSLGHQFLVSWPRPLQGSIAKVIQGCVIGDVYLYSDKFRKDLVIRAMFPFHLVELDATALLSSWVF